MSSQDFAEIEALVLRLYEPSQPGQIDAVQKQLQEAQRAHGWALADALLASRNQNVRFFAALTFQVKLNQDGAMLADETRLPILSKIIEWTVRLVAASESAIVVRKLCSALVNFFFLPKSPWTKCLRHFTCCLSHGQYIPEDTIDQHTRTAELLKTLNESQIVALLTLSSTLADESMRIDGTNEHVSECRKRINQNSDDVLTFLSYFLSLDKTSEIRPHKSKILICYLSWISYYREVYTAPDAELTRIRSFLQDAANCLLDEDTYEAAAEFFVDLFTTYEEFLETEDFSNFAKILESPWASLHLVNLKENSDNREALQFGQMALAYGQATSKLLNNFPDDTQHIMALMHEITRTQNYETIDQTMFNAVMDFWETFVTKSSKPDKDSPPSKQKAFTAAKENWLQAIEELCQGTALPIDSSGSFRKISADEPLSEFRARLVDAVQTYYADFDVAVLQQLVGLALKHYSKTRSHKGGMQSLGTFDYQALAYVESALNCLIGLAESLYYDSDSLELEDNELQKLFGSEMYADLTDMKIPIPMKLRQNAVNIIAGCDNFLSRYDQYLLSALEILLRSLEHSVLVNVSARAIWTLCDSSRAKLNSMAEHFLTVCQRFLVYPLADLESKEYVAGAAAAIIQASPPSKQQVTAIERLLTLIARFHAQPGEAFRGNETNLEELETRTLHTLNLLVSVGTALQTPDDALIELDEDEDLTSASALFTRVQSEILQFITSLLEPFLQNGPVLDAVCQVLRCGFRERQPGPFVFTPKAVIQLLISIPLTSPRVDSVLSTAGYLVSSKTSVPASLDDALAPLVNYLCVVIRHQEDLSTASDPEVLSAGMDLMARLVPTFLPCIFATVPEEYISIPLYASLKCLSGADVLPKRSAAALWTSLFNIGDAVPEVISDQVRKLIQALGWPLMTTLIANFGGRAARSELEFLSDPFRKLIVARPRESKEWMESALFSPTQLPSAGAFLSAGLISFPTEAKVSELDKRRFVSQVLHLRGEKRTNRVVREFWSACRAIPLGYS